MKTKTNVRCLPRGWQWVKIGDIAEVSTGGTPSTSYPEYYGGDIRWLKSGDVKGTYIDEVPNRITKLGLDNSNAKIHPPGSVMLAMSGQGKTRGTSAILRVPSACSQSVAAILPTEHAIPEIIHYALVNRYEDTRRITGDDERTGLNLKLIREIEIPLPPLDEQRQIASRLSEQLAAVESARKALGQQLGIARCLPSAYLRKVFQGEEARKWKIEKSGSVIDVRDGTHESPKFHDTGIPFLTSRNLKPFGLDFENIVYITQDDHERFKVRSKPDKGDILFGMIGTIGNPTIVETEREFSFKNMAIFKLANSPIVPEFLVYILQSDFMHKQLKKRMQGGIQKFVSLTVLRNLDVPVPSLDEQNRIVAEISDRRRECNKIIELIESQLAEINRLPASLLREAFTV